MIPLKGKSKENIFQTAENSQWLTDQKNYNAWPFQNFQFDVIVFEDLVVRGTTNATF